MSSRLRCSARAWRRSRAAASAAGRVFDRSFGTAHLLFTRIDDTYEKALDAATDLAQPALRAWISARPPSATARSARRNRSSRPSCVSTSAGVRHVILDFVGPYEERDRQIERFASEALAAAGGLRKTPS